MNGNLMRFLLLFVLVVPVQIFLSYLERPELIRIGGPSQDLAEALINLLILTITFTAFVGIGFMFTKSLEIILPTKTSQYFLMIAFLASIVPFIGFLRFVSYIVFGIT